MSWSNKCGKHLEKSNFGFSYIEGLLKALSMIIYVNSLQEGSIECGIFQNYISLEILFRYT